jgi:hypothetical protein
MEQGISIRQQVAQNLADLCVCGDLNDVYGVSCEKMTDQKSKKTYWSVIFCKSRILDGAIRVYSPSFILITWQTGIRYLPSKGKEVFKSEQAAKEFLTRTFIKGE